mmetsp:Transcript_36253/g.95276  ORF Transcript_36253/g.95276 Transcript_36253/m.95276 type:complete len:268 (-) Transcript_36253:41-844(-)
MPQYFADAISWKNVAAATLSFPQFPRLTSQHAGVPASITPQPSADHIRRNSFVGSLKSLSQVWPIGCRCTGGGSGGGDGGGGCDSGDCKGGRGDWRSLVEVIGGGGGRWKAEGPGTGFSRILGAAATCRLGGGTVRDSQCAETLVGGAIGALDGGVGVRMGSRPSCDRRISFACSWSNTSHSPSTMQRTPRRKAQAAQLNNGARDFSPPAALALAAARLRGRCANSSSSSLSSSSMEQSPSGVGKLRITCANVDPAGWRRVSTYSLA